MSGTFPSSPAPRSIDVRPVQPTRVSVAQSFKRNARTTNAHRWMLHLRFPVLQRDDAAPIIAFINSQRGRYDTFTYILPTPLHTPRGSGAVGSPSPIVDGNLVSPTGNVQNGRTILTSGWLPSVTPLKAGDLVQFGSHSKVYEASSEMLTDPGGRGTLVMNPSAHQDLAHGVTVVTQNIPFTVGLAADDWGYRVEPGDFFFLDDVDLVEVF